MFLAEPQRTAYDLHFQILGFDVRVTPFFWLVAAALGWGWADGLSTVYSEEIWQDAISQMPAEQAERVHELMPPTHRQRAETNPGAGMLLAIWITAMFGSILIHELGHTLAMRYYGTPAYIVLWHFGGLAIPDSVSSLAYMGYNKSPQQQIVISAAGPGAQLALAALVICLTKGMGYEVPTYIPFLTDALQLQAGQGIGSLPLYAVIDALIWPSVFWAVLNLVPVYPLDGGQISRELFMLFDRRQGMRNSLILSIVAGGAVAAWGLSSGSMMMGMMFASLAFSSFQILQAISGRGGGGYGPW